MAVPTLWRTKQQRYNLVGEKCPACTNAVFPPRKVCPHCGETMSGETMSAETMSAVPTHQTHFSFSMPRSFTPHYFSAQVAGDD